MKISRRSFLKAATAIGASLAWVGPARGSRVRWHERRDLYPQGVASGDPDPHSVILWTRRPFTDRTRQLLTVEVAEDEAFRRVIAHAQAPVSSAADWTARALIGGLKPARALTGIGLPTATETAAGSAAQSRLRCQTMPVR
jgi:alkaline phosphatase D